MKRLFVLVALASLALLALVAPAAAQSVTDAPPDTSRVPIRPFDPPEPEPVFIPELVSGLVVTDLGEALEISPLSANPSFVVPGSGPLVDFRSWIAFAAPALLPLLGALILFVITRVPQRSPAPSPPETTL